MLESQAEVLHRSKAEHIHASQPDRCPASSDCPQPIANPRQISHILAVAGTEEVGLAAMEGWHWTPGLQQGFQWNLGGGQIGDGNTQHGSLEGVDSLPEAMAKSRQQASRRVSRSNSRQFERMASQVSCSHTKNLTN